jgi:hypothetical protein
MASPFSAVIAVTILSQRSQQKPYFKSKLTKRSCGRNMLHEAYLIGIFPDLSGARGRNLTLLKYHFNIDSKKLPEIWNWS